MGELRHAPWPELHDRRALGYSGAGEPAILPLRTHVRPADRWVEHALIQATGRHMEHMAYAAQPPRTARLRNWSS